MKTVNLSSQSGMVLIAMVMILWMLSLLLLTAMMQVQSYWQKADFYEKRYYQHYNQAYSGLNWALSQAWPVPSRIWYCQRMSSLSLTACFKTSSQADFVLVKGVSKTLPLYYLAQYLPNGQLAITQGHWLDFCPEKKQRDCDE
ncbi:DUF2509 family protein [Utexia brackfieldae]|uniref:DUF2509 family protein n=1 Tax=Utexia brackfieldae TaxID=3074108 RepID=UPI00370D1C87